MKISQNEGIFINGATNGSTDLTVLDSTGALYGNGIYARSGSTAVQVASSTGQLWHKGAAVTPTAAEINTLAASAVTNADLVKLHAVTATAAVINDLTAWFGAPTAYTTVAGSTTIAIVSGSVNITAADTAQQGLFSLNNPIAGVRLSIFASVAASSAEAVLVASSSNIGFNSTLYNMLSFAVNSAVQLVGVSTKIWAVTGAVAGTVNFTTST